MISRIDIEQVIASKSERFLKIVPRVLIRYLRRIIHQDELNVGLTTLAETRDLDFFDGALELLGVSATVRGEERLPDNGRCICVSNHPLGGLDGMLLAAFLGKRYAGIKIPANDLLLNLPTIERLFIAVNKHGSNRENRAALEAAYAGDETLLHFPAGLCSRRTGARIKDVVWQKSFIRRARRYRRDIVPIHFAGHNSSFFYGLANLRKRLGIGFNIEMLYLVDEMFKQRGRDFEITVGHPISWRVFDKRLDDWAWARQLRRHIYRLEEHPSERFPWSVVHE